MPLLNIIIICRNDYYVFLNFLMDIWWILEKFNKFAFGKYLYDRDLDEYKFSNNVLMTKCIRSLGHYCFHSSWMFLRCTS